MESSLYNNDALSSENCDTSCASEFDYDDIRYEVKKFMQNAEDYSIIEGIEKRPQKLKELIKREREKYLDQKNRKRGKSMTLANIGNT